MEPIHTLLDREHTTEPPVLPDDLRALYGGDLQFPASGYTRPYVIGNFVTTLDGVVSYLIPGQSGGAISGFNEGDRFIMGLLRASADAVIVGSGTVHDVSPAHLWIAKSIYPKVTELYAHYRQDSLGKPKYPLVVVVSGTGKVDFGRAIFRTPDVPVLIITSEDGGERLAAAGTRSGYSAEMRALKGEGTRIPASRILALLWSEFGIRLLLHEGGPTLFGEFLAHRLVDELFLTLAPQIAGRTSSKLRPSLAAVEFLPDTASWLGLLSAKQRGDHLYLRYRMR